MQRLITILWYVAIVVSFVSVLWSASHNLIVVCVIVGLADIALSLVCWRLAARRANRRRRAIGRVTRQ